MNIYLNAGKNQENETCISRIVQLGDFFYLSSQTGQGETIVEQTIEACNKIVEALQDFNLRFDHIVKFTIYLTNLENKKEFLSIFQNFLEAPYPAISIVQVQALENGAMVAIEGQGVNTLRHENSHKESGCKGHCQDCHCE